MAESGSKVVTKTPKATLPRRQDLTPKEAQARADALAEEKKRIAEVLSRGLVTDMVHISDGDPDKRYVWVRERDIDMKKFQALGYSLETEAGESEHGAGDDRRRVGDVVLMSVARERYDLIEEVRREQRRKRIDSPIKEYKTRAEAAAQRGEAAPPVDFMEQEE